MEIQYGTCPYCGGKYESHKVEIDLTVDGKEIVLTDQPQGYCPACESRVYKTEVLEKIERFMKTGR
jgi:YgiT-type zinc finger domain-containing protein